MASTRHIILIEYYIVAEILQKKKPLCMFLCNMQNILMEATFSTKLVHTYSKF